jgi:aminoglycoside phosphotransferase (APT) family kinase protein
VSVLALQPLFGGNARAASAFRLRYRAGGEAREMPCVMLSQETGRQVDSDVAKEFAILRAIDGAARAPRAVAVDESGATVGAPSIVLERLPGAANAVAFLERTDAATGARLMEELAAVIAEMHAAPCPAAAYGGNRQAATARELAERQVEEWAATFEARRMEPLPVMASLFGWLRDHLPEPRRIGLVHGDLRPGNFLYDGARVTGLLDWEMAHAGDPLEDIAWLYRPLWSPERFLPLHEFVMAYGRRAGVEIAWADVLYYRVFSELKFATISLAAASAFSSGRTRNLRHADRAATVGPCLRRCLEWIASHREESARVPADDR